MNFKKIFAGAVASAMAVSAMAAVASAETLALDESKVLWGDPEGKGNLRIEIYNAYGSTTSSEAYDAAVSPINPDDVANVTEISVTFTLTGAPEGEYEAVLGFADGSWSAQDWESAITVTGDGTYTITSAFAPWQDEETGADIPALATGVTVFVIDIKGMGTDAGIETSDDVPYQMDVVTVSDISIELTVDETAGDDASGDDASGDDASGDDASGDDASGDDASGDSEGTTTTTTAATTTSGSSSSSSSCGGSNATVVLGVLAVAAVAVLFIKKRV